jgi:hypothetical protein
MLQRYYGGSLWKALNDAYPHHQFLAWKFDSRPRNFWSKLDNQRLFFDYAMKQLNLQSMEDWYRVERKKIEELGGPSSRLIENRVWFGGD